MEPQLPVGPYHLPGYNGTVSVSSLGPDRVRGMGPAVGHPSVAAPRPAWDVMADAVPVESRGFVSQGVSEGAGWVYEM